MPKTEVRDLDFANDASKLLAHFADRMLLSGSTLASPSLNLNERRALRTLLADLIFFVTQFEGSAADPFEIELANTTTTTSNTLLTIKQPQGEQHGITCRERQKLLREQNILKQIFRILKVLI